MHRLKCRNATDYAEHIANMFIVQTALDGATLTKLLRMKLFLPSNSHFFKLKIKVMSVTLVSIQKSWVVSSQRWSRRYRSWSYHWQGSRRLHRGQPTHCLGFQIRTQRPSMPRMQGLTYSLRPPRYQRLVSSSSVKEIKTSFYQCSLDGCWRVHQLWWRETNGRIRWRFFLYWPASSRACALILKTEAQKLDRRDEDRQKTRMPLERIRVLYWYGKLTGSAHCTACSAIYWSMGENNNLLLLNLQIFGGI